MVYEYSGFLSTILYKPDPEARDRLDHVLFTGEDLARWLTRDYVVDKEWQRVPAQRMRTEKGVRLVGRFHDIIQIDNLSVDEAHFWAPLSSFESQDTRFPIDLATHPIAEITYRCTSDNAHPAWMWTYPGGRELEFLPATSRWQTVARKIGHFGFPREITGMAFRVYSTQRTDESIEIESLRFRAMSKEENEACQKEYLNLRETHPPQHYPALDSFLPLGVFVNAEVARRLAEVLGISLREYWALALEDIGRRHHNCIAVEKAERFTAAEFREMLDMAEKHDIRVVPFFDVPLDDDEARLEGIIESMVKPCAETSPLLAWSLINHPTEEALGPVLERKRALEEADPLHPVVQLTRSASSYPLYAPFFAARGIKYFPSHDPWVAKDLIQSHVHVGGGQQFWMVGPAFVYATGTPDWPNCPEMRLMTNLSIAKGARGWFSYAYHNDPAWITGSCQRTLTGPFLAFSDLWLEIDKRMARLNVITPLLLNAEPASLPPEWSVVSTQTGDHTALPEGIPPTSSYRLEGTDFDLYFVVNNDVRGMTEVLLKIPPEIVDGRDVYDISDFIHTWNWTPPKLERQIEMFPGQARLILVANPETSTYWRDVISQRLIDDDLRKSNLNLALTQAHGVDASAVEEKLNTTGHGDLLHDLVTMHTIRAMTLNLLYQTPAIWRSRSKIIETASALCACDGALCRLLNKGRADLARELGLNVLPIARESTQLRLELRAGKGDKILPHCENLSVRALKLLEQIRAQF